MDEIQPRDEEGRRRFHGAFTGGYSAGYYNTVGSKEGVFYWNQLVYVKSANIDIELTIRNMQDGLPRHLHHRVKIGPK